MKKKKKKEENNVLTKKRVGLRIDHFHNGDQIEYSFVLMLKSPISLASLGTIQKNISTKVRPVGLININTKA